MEILKIVKKKKKLKGKEEQNRKYEK